MGGGRDRLTLRPRTITFRADQTAGRSRACASAFEESPGSTATRRRVTPAGGDPRDSATESKPPAASAKGKGERGGEETTADRAAGTAWQAPLGARPNRDPQGSPSGAPAPSPASRGSGWVARTVQQW